MANARGDGISMSAAAMVDSNARVEIPVFLTVPSLISVGAVALAAQEASFDISRLVQAEAALVWMGGVLDLHVWAQPIRRVESGGLEPK